MRLRRGDLVTVAAKGAYTGKPRPAVVIQAGETLPYRDSVTVCLLTSELIDGPLFRVRISVE
jgi:mRNA interferase MazF